MSETLDFRNYIKELTDKPAPADPSAFIQEMIDATKQRADTLDETMESTDNDDLRDEVDEFVDSITGNAETVRDKLEGAKFGTFDVVHASIDYNYSWKFFRSSACWPTTRTTSMRNNATPSSETRAFSRATSTSSVVWTDSTSKPIER